MFTFFMFPYNELHTFSPRDLREGHSLLLHSAYVHAKYYAKQLSLMIS